MGYPESVDYANMLIPTTTGGQTAVNLIATAAQYCGYAVLKPLTVNRLAFFCVTATVAPTVAPLLSVTSRPTYGSATNAVTIGSMTIPTGVTAGSVIYKDIKNNVVIPAGYELSLNVVSAGTGSGSAGTGWFFFEYSMAVDADMNQSKMTVGS